MSQLAHVMDNKTILQKADLALSDLTTDGGLLAPAQAKKFMRILINESVIMNQATVVPMRSHKQEINKIRFRSRVLRAGQEAVALAAEVYEGGADGGLYVENDAFVDVSCDFADGVALDVELLEFSIFDDGDAAFLFLGGVDKHFLVDGVGFWLSLRFPRHFALSLDVAKHQQEKDLRLEGLPPA